MKLTKAQLRQTIEEELASEGFFDSFTKKGRAKKAAEEDAQAAAKRLEKTLSDAAEGGMTLSDETKALALKLLAANPRRLRAWDAIKQAQKQRGEPTWAEESEARHQKTLAYLGRHGRRANFGSEDPNSRVQAKRWRSGGLGYGESKDHAMKLDKNTLAQMIKEELEVILTDEEAVEMFGLENILTEESVDDMLSAAYGRLGKKYSKAGGPDPAKVASEEGDDNGSLARKTLKGISQHGTGLEEEETNEGCGDDAHKRDDEEDDELSPDEGGPSGTSAKKDTRPDSELTRDVKEGIDESKTPKPRMKENNLFMTRDKLAEMIRQEMTRTIRRNKENA